MSSSSTLDFFTSAIKNTYDETVDYWSKDGSVSDAVDTVVWTAQNTGTVAEATSKGIEKSANELGNAIKYDAFKVIGIALLFLYLYNRFIKGGK